MGLFNRRSKASTREHFRKTREDPPSVGIGKVGWNEINSLGYDFLKRDGGPVSLVSAAKILRPSLLEQQVVGGIGTEPDEFQEVVAVGDETEYWASGILIDRQYVLTAGHVDALGEITRVSVGSEVKPSKLCSEVKPSKLCKDADELSSEPEEIEVGDSPRHPHFWDEPFFTHDLAVLKLDRPARRTRGISLRDLVTAGEFEEAKIGRLVGYGETNHTGTSQETRDSGTAGFGIRRKVDVPIVHHKDLRRPHRFEEEHSYDKRFEFVAAAPLLDKDACSGDSGGGFYVRSCFRWKLAGMVSRQFGLYGTHCGAGSIYLRLYEYRDCIQAMIDQLDEKPGARDLRTACPKEIEEYEPARPKPGCGCCGCLSIPWRLLRG